MRKVKDLLRLILAIEMLFSICYDSSMDKKELIYQIGCNIRAERNRLRLSQEELAETVDLSTNHLGVIERGEKEPKITTIISIMEALDIPFEALYKRK